MLFWFYKMRCLRSRSPRRLDKISLHFTIKKSQALGIFFVGCLFYTQIERFFLDKSAMLANNDFINVL